MRVTKFYVINFNAEVLNQVSVKEIDLSKASYIGGGGFGSVYRTKWAKRGDIDVAVKVCHGNVLHGREVQILSNLPRHPNVIELLGVARSDDSITTYIITELATGGSLHDFFAQKQQYSII